MNEELMQNKSLLKVFMNLVSPFNLKCNKQDEQIILQNNEDTSSKKDMTKRREELMEFIIEDLVRYVNLNIRFFLTDPSYANLLVDLIDNAPDVKIDEPLAVLRVMVSCIKTSAVIQSQGDDS